MAGRLIRKIMHTRGSDADTTQRERETERVWISLTYLSESVSQCSAAAS